MTGNAMALARRLDEPTIRIAHRRPHHLLTSERIGKTNVDLWVCHGASPDDHTYCTGNASERRRILGGNQVTGNHGWGFARGGAKSSADAASASRALTGDRDGTAVALSRWESIMIELNRILCPIDFSEYSDHALRYAMKMAHWYGAQLHVLHVMPPLPPSTMSPLSEASRRLTARNLAAAVERWREPHTDATTEIIESAEPSARILERADALDVELIVVGSHGRKGVERMLLGSVVEPLLHQSRRPVFVIPAGLNLARLEHPVDFTHVVCAVDFGAPSLAALAYALSIAEESDARLTVLNVIEKPPELTIPLPPPDFDVYQVRAEAEASRLRRLHALVPESAHAFCSVETAVMEGGASRSLLQLAEQRHADLIVMGVHGRRAIDVAVFGSNAKDVIRRAHCPVLIVPGGSRRAALRTASWREPCHVHT
jgi:nucleotide-binding universal stress UspA family protein